MGYTNDGKHAMLDHLATQISHVSLHTAYPATSENEVSGGEPAYARQSITWEANAGDTDDGELHATNQPEFNVPEDTTVAAVGFWTDDDVEDPGDMLAQADVTDETFANQGTYTIISAVLDLNK